MRERSVVGVAVLFFLLGAYGLTLDYLKPDKNEERIQILENNVKNVVDGVNKALAELRAEVRKPKTPEKK